LRVRRDLLGIEGEIVTQYACGLFAASLPITEISSSNVAMSSSKVNKLLPAKMVFLIDCLRFFAC
jgi:hypothetical protein